MFSFRGHVKRQAPVTPVLFLVASGMFAVNVVPAYTAAGPSSCLPNGGPVSAEQATQFLQSPLDLLAKFKDGQGGLSAQVRDLVSSRPETIEGMKSLATGSSPDQSRAIGAGLGTAAAVCVLSQPTAAQLIQEIVLKTENRDLIQSFISVTGDIPTEAINGAPASGDDSAGGGRGTGTVSRGPSGADPTQQFNPALAASPVFSAATGNAVTLLNSVSPSQ